MSKKPLDKPLEKAPSKDFHISSQKEKEILQRIALTNPQNKEDYTRIIDALSEQGKTLHSELEVMSAQVKKLRDKNKDERPQQEKMEREIIEKKAELQTKYREFDDLKKEVEEAKAKNLDPEVQAKLQSNNNLLKEMDKEVQELEQTRKKLHKYLRNNNESMKEYDHEDLPEELEELLRENRELKKRAQEERKKEEEIRYQEIKAQKNYVDLRLKARKMEAKEAEPKSSNDLKALKEENYSKEAILDIEKAVEILKNKKEEIQAKEERQKAEKTRKREQLFKKNQELLEQSKVLEMEKVKLKQEINKYETLSLEIQSSKKKDRDVRKKEGLHQETQTESKEHLLVLRRDYAGVIGRNRFDDRLRVLEGNFNTKINKVIVYENSKGIAAVKFQYFQDTYPDHIYQTEMIVPQAYLTKCKKKSFEVSKTNDFFKLFKVKSLAQERRISKIEVVSNLNIKAEFGDKKSFEQISKEDIVYGFDINVNEVPVSMFGSVSQVGSEWFLESLGAEIKGLGEKVKL